MAVTFKDIADRAGVSYSTVSRVINDHPSVSEEAAKAVRAAMHALGYEPPPPERRRGPQRGGSPRVLTGNVALLFPDVDQRAMSTPLSAALAHGVEDYLYDQRISMIMTHLREESRLPPCLERRQADGVILRGGELSASLQNRLRGFPCVWIFQTPHPLTWADQVCPDNEAVGAMAARYLHEKGACKAIAVNPDVTHTAFRRRASAFLETAAELGIRGTLVDVTDGHPLISGLGAAIKKGYAPDGIFSVGGDAAMETLYRELLARSIKPCDDVPLISCNNDINRLWALDPRLPNIDIQPEVIGRTAAERLLWRFENPKEPTQRVFIAPTLEVA